MPRLSVIVPFAGHVERFETTLVSVLEHRPPDCEVLVAHPSTYDDPWGLGDEVRFVAAPPSSGRAAVLGAAFRAAGGRVIHWLQDGLRAREGWTAAAVERLLGEERAAAASPLVAGQTGGRAWTIAGAAYAPSGAWRLLAEPAAGGPLPQWWGPSWLAGFYRREALERVGGWDGRLTSDWAAMDAAIRLQRARWRAVLAPECRIDVWDWPGEEASGIAAGWSAERVFWRHARALGLLRSLAAHSLAIGGRWARAGGWGELAGRLGAWLPAPAVGGPRAARRAA